MNRSNVRFWHLSDINVVSLSVRFSGPVQPIDATLSVLKGKDGGYDETSRVFSRLHCGRETGDFGIADSARKTLGFKPQQIE